MKQYHLLAAALIASVSFGVSAASAKVYNFQEVIDSQVVGSFNLDDVGSQTPGICCGMTVYPASSATGAWAGVDVNLLITGYISGFFPGANGSFTGDISWAHYFATPSNTGLDGTTGYPIFIPGTYTGINYFDGAPATLVISAVSGPKAPAPLAGGGLMGMLAMLIGLALPGLAKRRHLFS